MTIQSLDVNPYQGFAEYLRHMYDRLCGGIGVGAARVVIDWSLVYCIMLTRIYLE